MGAYIKNLIPWNSGTTRDYLDCNWLFLRCDLYRGCVCELKNRIHGGRNHAKRHSKNAPALLAHVSILFRRRINCASGYCVYFHKARARDTHEPSDKISSFLAISWSHGEQNQLSESVQTGFLNAVYSCFNPLECMYLLHRVAGNWVWHRQMGLPRNQWNPNWKTLVTHKKIHILFLLVNSDVDDNWRSAATPH